MSVHYKVRRVRVNERRILLELGPTTRRSGTIAGQHFAPALVPESALRRRSCRTSPTIAQDRPSSGRSAFGPDYNRFGEVQQPATAKAERQARTVHQVVHHLGGE
jgi:hypothetical protein